MKSKIIKFTQKPFVRNVVALASGTAAAQAISFVFAPIITRLYSPEVFGVLGVFVSILVIVKPISALTYPIAIVLPQNDSDAKGLIALSLYIAAVMAVLMAFVLIVFNKPLVYLLKVEVIASYLFLIPLVMLFGAAVHVVKQWMIRKKQFIFTSRVTALHSFIINSSRAGAGLFHPVAAVLVIIETLDDLIEALILSLGARKTTSNSANIGREVSPPASKKELAKRYRDFPLFRAPQVFVKSVSYSLPILMLTSFFGPAAAGYYTIGQRVLDIPAMLISKSVGEVFYPRIVQAAHDNENLTTLIFKATLALAAVGFVPYAVVVAFGPWLFGFVFGTEWIRAGLYARWMALWLFFAFLSRPAIDAIPVLNIQGFFLVFEIVSTGLRIGTLFVFFKIFNNDIYVVAAFSVISTLLSFFLITYTILHAHKKRSTA